MASARIRSKYNLSRDKRESDNKLKLEMLRAQEQNEAAADSSFWGRLGGAGAGALLGLALAPVTGGASLAVTAALGGAGSYFGSKAGEKAAGGIDTDVESGGFGMDRVSAINRELTSYAEGVEEDRMMSAASDAFSIYAAGGGLTGGGIGGGTGMFGKQGVSQLANLSKSSGYLSSIGQSVKAGGSQLIKGGASQYAKKQGYDTAYESYMQGK